MSDKQMNSHSRWRVRAGNSDGNSNAGGAVARSPGTMPWGGAAIGWCSSPPHRQGRQPDASPFETRPRALVSQSSASVRQLLGRHRWGEVRWGGRACAQKTHPSRFWYRPPIIYLGKANGSRPLKTPRRHLEKKTNVNCWSLVAATTHAVLTRSWPVLAQNVLLQLIYSC